MRETINERTATNNDVAEAKGTNFMNGKKKTSKQKIFSTKCLVTILLLNFNIFVLMTENKYLNDVFNNNETALRGFNGRGGGGEEKATEQQKNLSPFFSIEPSTHSFHPKYKLWTEMSTKEQDEVMDGIVGETMKKYADIIFPKDKKLHQVGSVKHGECTFDEKIGSTGHTLCGPAPPKPCAFISFGINDDPSWDREVADIWGCRGFAGDPTVQLPSKIHDLVTFHNIAAVMLQDNEERLINKGGEGEWWTTSFPKLRYFLGLEKIDILKIDCEGCEVSLAKDILREDPDFLLHVDQISIETHTTKTWMTTREHVYYFGLLLVLLEEAGFKMEWSSVFGCSKRHEITGCMPDLEKYGWPCGYKPWPGHPNVVKGYSCQEFTWKRY